MNTKQKLVLRLPEELRDAIRRGIVRYGKVKVIGLGIFETRRINARPGRNPKTGEIVKIPAYTKIKFRATQSLKDAV